MNRFLSKKILLITIIVVLILTVIASIVFLISKSNTEINSFTVKKISDIAQSDRIDKNLKIASDSNLSEKERYTAFIKILFDLKAKYFALHDPSLREFIMVDLNVIAKSNFPKEYIAEDFKVACSDPKCGQEINAELKEIIDDIQKDPYIPDHYKNTILKNLLTAGYAPDKQEADKNEIKFGLELATNQLESLGLKSASDSAYALKSYLFRQHDYNYVNYEILQHK